MYQLFKSARYAKPLQQFNYMHQSVVLHHSAPEPRRLAHPVPDPVWDGCCAAFAWVRRCVERTDIESLAYTDLWLHGGVTGTLACQLFVGEHISVPRIPSVLVEHTLRRSKSNKYLKINRAHLQIRSPYCRVLTAYVCCVFYACR